MDRRIINPWTWQDNFGFVQGHEVTGAQRTLYCAGQTSTDENGRTLHPEDMGAQLRQALENLETVLRQADMDLSNVVRLNMYTTDVDRFLASYHVLVERLTTAGCRPSATLLGVTRLAFPDLLLELEATAVA